MSETRSAPDPAAPDTTTPATATAPPAPPAPPAAGIDVRPAEWDVAKWHGRHLVDVDGTKLGRLEDVYVDVETDVPQFATVKHGHLRPHLTFVPLSGIRITPDELRVTATKEQVLAAPHLELHGEALSATDEATLYHHFGQNYTASGLESGRRLVRR